MKNFNKVLAVSNFWKYLLNQICCSSVKMKWKSVICTEVHVQSGTDLDITYDIADDVTRDNTDADIRWQQPGVTENSY